MRESTFFVRVATTLSKLNTDFVLNSSLGVFKDFVKDLDLSDAERTKAADRHQASPWTVDGLPPPRDAASRRGRAQQADRVGGAAMPTADRRADA
ncbi:hypothetical protein AAVH_20551 [Aphelenchoides avenae]|nr:hypothetical protein AAVH_20551 [Aphelenchus avenae]